MSALDKIQAEHRAADAKRAMFARSRAQELSDRRPQLYKFSPAPPDLLSPQQKEEIYGSGGEAGLRRVIGAGRRKRNVLKQMPHSNTSIGAEIVEEESESDMEGAGRAGGAAHSQGAHLAQHLHKIHGAGFLDDFARGFMSVIKPIANVASFVPGPIGMIGKVVSGVMGSGEHAPAKKRGGARSKPMLPNAHAAMSPVQMVPGALPPVAMGNTPQAPESFRRNQVGMGRAGGGRAGGASMEGCGPAGGARPIGAGRAGGGRAGGGRAGGASMDGCGTLSITHEGGGFLDDVKEGLKPLRTAYEVAKIVGKVYKTAAKSMMGKKGGASMEGCGTLSITHEGAGITRGAVVRRIMCEKNMTLPAASKHLKELCQQGHSLADVMESLRSE